MLLSEVDRDRIVPAQIVSTQLEAGDLLRSVALAFGIAPKTLSKAELIATIEAYLTLLVTENKRALLIVDEAQNLNREAVEELRMLSNFQLGNQELLQSFLVGPPRRARPPHAKADGAVPPAGHRLVPPGPDGPRRDAGLHRASPEAG